MNSTQEGLNRTVERSANIAKVFERRARIAQDRFNERVTKAAKTLPFSSPGTPANPLSFWNDWTQYTIDAFQRSVLFWDTMRQRGNEYRRARSRPDCRRCCTSTTRRSMDGAQRSRGRSTTRWCASCRPRASTVDPKRRPYVIIDPRAGHGPGIGGFKDDSQVGVALRAGHPVYFVIFFPDPEPGQTLIDVCDAEKAFVRKVRELHPEERRSPRSSATARAAGRR